MPSTPNPAHRALARLEAELGDDLLIVTQNIDDLHERGGATRVLHMHGELRSALCRGCGRRTLLGRRPRRLPTVPGLRGRASCAPTWCGSARSPTRWTGSSTALDAADLFVSIGTSGAVYPAAGFVQVASAGGARTLELNLAASEGTHLFDESRHGPASLLVPAWVDEVV